MTNTHNLTIFHGEKHEKVLDLSLYGQRGFRVRCGKSIFYEYLAIAEMPPAWRRGSARLALRRRAVGGCRRTLGRQE